MTTDPLNLGREAFERLVARALDELPDEFAQRLDNVSVVVEDEPDAETLDELGMEPGDELFGLYQGTPLIERGVGFMGLPDRIVIYRGPTLRACRTPSEVVREVQKTVVHEIGHHFGLDEEDMPY